MSLNNSINITRTLSKAVPTVDENGLVKTWRVCIGYSCSECARDFEFDVKAEHLNKTPNDFTQAEILSLCNLERLDRAFNCIHNSLSVSVGETIIEDFDVTSLN